MTALTSAISNEAVIFLALSLGFLKTIVSYLIWCHLSGSRNLRQIFMQPSQVRASCLLAKADEKKSSIQHQTHHKLISATFGSFATALLSIFEPNCLSTILITS